MSADDFDRHTDLKMLLHHIYEFQKGVRRSGALHDLPDVRPPDG